MVQKSFYECPGLSAIIRCESAFRAAPGFVLDGKCDLRADVEKVTFIQSSLHVVDLCVCRARLASFIRRCAPFNDTFSSVKKQFMDAAFSKDRSGHFNKICFESIVIHCRQFNCL